MKIALNQYLRPSLEPNLPKEVEAAWFRDTGEAVEAVSGAEAALLDLFGPGADPAAVIRAGKDLKWVMTSLAGVESYPLELMAERGIVFTNGAGINAVPVAEWAVLGVLALAKNFHQVIVHHERAEWPKRAPGTGMVFGSQILIIGYGHSGKEIGNRLAAMGAKVVGVRRNPDRATEEIGLEEWRPLLGKFDFVILAAPGTAETNHLIGSAELAAMKPGAGIVNIARGSLIDQDALIEAARSEAIGGAFLDVTDPEPLPPDHPLWRTPRITVTSHLAGRAQTGMGERSAALFLDNLQRYRDGRTLLNRVDPALGY